MKALKKLFFFHTRYILDKIIFPAIHFIYSLPCQIFFPLWWLNLRTKRQAATYFGDSTNNFFFASSSHLQLPSLLKWLSVIIIFYSFFLIPHTRNLLSLLSSSSSSSCCLMLSSCFLTFLKRIMYKFFFSRCIVHKVRKRVKFRMTWQ